MTEFKRIPGTDYVGPADHWMHTTSADNPTPPMATDQMLETMRTKGAELESKRRQWKEHTEKIECSECGRRVVVEDFNTLVVCKCLFEKLRQLRQRPVRASISEPRLTAQVFGLHGIEIRCDP